ncbi:MAG: hypothetical protein LBQ79_14990 [Deltaproteobacteria bacterium]|nr:hypothetical protein [Deltaproteobacteria bacterium]
MPGDIILEDAKCGTAGSGKARRALEAWRAAALWIPGSMEASGHEPRRHGSL